MASSIYGIRGSGTFDVPEEVPEDYHQMLFKLVPDTAPFYGLLSKAKKSTVSSPKFHLFEERMPQMHLVVDGSHTNTDTTISVDGPGTYPTKGFKLGDLVRCIRTGEVMRVSAAPSTPWTTLTVATRGSWVESGGADDKAALNDGDILRWIGSAYPEATTAPDGVSQDIDYVYNFVQDFQDSAEISDIVDATEIRPEQAWKREKRLSSLRHMLKIESALLFGKRALVIDSNSQYNRGTGGLNYFISTNRIDHTSSGTSVDLLETAMAQLFKYGSRTKLGWAGMGAMSKLNKLVRKESVANFHMGDKLDDRSTYGLYIKNFEHPSGTLQLAPHPLLTEDTTLTNYIFIVDFKNIEWVTMKGLGTKWEDNIKTDDGYTGHKGRWRTVAGLKMALEEVHGLFIVGDYLP